MSLKNCSVVYQDSPRGVFYSGQLVNGLFNITLDSAKKIYGLSIEVIGEAKTQWKGKYGEGKRRKSAIYEAHDIYFKSGQVSLTQGFQKSGEWITIKAGLSSFNFSAQLPPLLPSSFEGEIGKIRYYVKVTLNLNKKEEKWREFPFNVLCTSDLNANPTNALPIKQVLSKKYRFMCTNVGLLEITTELPKSGFVPGQEIYIDCHINNRQTIPVMYCSFTLMRIVTYFSTSPCGITKIEKNRVVGPTEHLLDKESQTSFRSILTVPSIAPTSILNNSVITVQYVIRVHAKVTGVYADLKGDIPIIIGTVPIPALPTPNYSPAQRTPESQPFDFMSSDVPSTPGSEYYFDSMASAPCPPTYEESQRSTQTSSKMTTIYGGMIDTDKF